MLGITASSATVGGGGTPPGPVAIVNNSGTTVTPQGSDVYRVEKTGGADGSWDADAVAATGFTGDFVVRVQPLQNNKSKMFGITSDPLANSSFNTLDYALYLEPGTAVGDYYSNGSQAGTGALYGAHYFSTWRFFMRRVGTTLTFLKGLTDNIADATVDFTFNSVTGTLFFDCSINGSGGGFDVYAEAL